MRGRAGGHQLDFWLLDGSDALAGQGERKEKGPARMQSEEINGIKMAQRESMVSFRFSFK